MILEGGTLDPIAKAADGTSKPPNVGTYIDAMAALVPAEVLAFHAIMVSIGAETKAGVTTITNVLAMQSTFWTLVALSILLYLVPHFLSRSGNLEREDYIRMLLPPLAFTAWTMLQRATAFDAIAPMLNPAVRTLIALVLAALVGLVASILANQANKQQPA